MQQVFSAISLSKSRPPIRSADKSNWLCELPGNGLSAAAGHGSSAFLRFLFAAFSRYS
jgi:hypothetical protein